MWKYQLYTSHGDTGQVSNNTEYTMSTWRVSNNTEYTMRAWRVSNFSAARAWRAADFMTMTDERSWKNVRLDFGVELSFLRPTPHKIDKFR